MRKKDKHFEEDVINTVLSQLQWGEKSISVARKMFIEHLSPKDIAADLTISKQYVNSIKNRFITKIERYQIEQFTRENKPTALIDIDSHSNEIIELHHQGYSIQQILEYLKGINVKTTPNAIQIILRTLK